MKCYVVAPNVPQNIFKYLTDAAYIIAVDKAVLSLNEQGIKYDLAVGDFDSLKDEDLIKSEKVKLNAVKDESDTKKAIEIAYASYEDVTLLGGLQGHRVDHLYANLVLLQQYPKLTIKDEHNLIQSKSKGTYAFLKNELDYLSIFAIEDAIIDITGVRYPLSNYKLKKDNPIGLSNEIITTARLDIFEGVLLIIQSKD